MSAKPRWYVLHVYSGFEQKVKDAIMEKAKKQGLEESIHEIMVPKEEVTEIKRGKRVNTERNVFPGYVMIKMELSDDAWHLIKDTPKVTGFVGGATNPPSLPESEVLGITRQVSDGVLKPKPKISFERGETVRIVDGPFTSFSGVVEEIHPEKGKLRISVSIFGRATPVELEFVQVEKG